MYTMQCALTPAKFIQYSAFIYTCKYGAARDRERVWQTNEFTLSATLVAGQLNTAPNNTNQIENRAIISDAICSAVPIN